MVVGCSWVVDYLLSIPRPWVQFPVLPQPLRKTDIFGLFLLWSFPTHFSHKQLTNQTAIFQAHFCSAPAPPLLVTFSLPNSICVFYFNSVMPRLSKNCTVKEHPLEFTWTWWWHQSLASALSHRTEETVTKASLRPVNCFLMQLPTKPFPLPACTFIGPLWV